MYPYSPAPPPPRGTPGLGALLLSIFVLLAMPIVFILTPLFAGARQYMKVVTILGPLGALVWLAALVLGVRALVVAGRTQSSTVLGWISIVLSILALGTGAAGWFLGFAITAGGGPR
ncbi:MAG: hypothetical protein ACXVEF_17860 [Polyangiales bacterium]